VIADGLHAVPPGKVAMVVTHLEMMSQAPQRPVDLPSGVAFAQIAPDVARYRALFDHVGRDWLWYGRRTLADTQMLAILNDPKVAFYTLRHGGRDAALLELDFRTKDTCALAYFGLANSLIGSGAGRFLMNKAIALAWAQPITRFHVHTCTTDSPQALGFYVRSGFTPYKQQIEIDDDPRLKGVLPDTAAPHVPLIRPQ
tara:strand:- start:1249 stop:1845 length:597 start_codon:yes stop_codon:yes gene_type:complete